jgi:hypothetical protein
LDLLHFLQKTNFSSYFRAHSRPDNTAIRQVSSHQADSKQPQSVLCIRSDMTDHSTPSCCEETRCLIQSPYIIFVPGIQKENWNQWVKILKSAFQFKYLNCTAGSNVDNVQFIANVANWQSCKFGRLSRWNEEDRNIANDPGHLVRRYLDEGRKLRSDLTENMACLFYKNQFVAVI